MAERRMFAKTIVTSDAFLDMPPTARCLYFLLSMIADDDGFVNAPRSVMRQSGATEDDMKLLIAKRFVLTFESGVIVIKHWKIHNLIQKDRYKETKYIEEKNRLVLDENNAYTESENALDTKCIQDVSKVETQVRLGKDSLVKDNKNNIVEIVSYLNEKAGTEFRATSKDTQRHINARLGEGFTVEDFKLVIDKKVTEWKGTNMAQYLRPQTLFGTKFESYLNAKTKFQLQPEAKDGIEALLGV